MKTKFIFGVFLLSMLSFGLIQDLIKVDATFEEHDEGSYFFIDEDEGGYSFQRIDTVAAKKYDLTDPKFIGKKFTVSYRIETEIDEDDEAYEIYAIMDLKIHR